MSAGFTGDEDPRDRPARTPVLPGAGERLPGVVIFHDWFPIPWSGRLARGVAGDVQVVTAVDVLGHDVNNRDSNWGVVVHGETSQLVVLGCQVRSVWLGEGVANDEMVAVP